jgi:DNA-binding NarL/FixJ family response regulator
VAKEIPARHRAEIYEKHNLRERLSVVARTQDDGLFAVNLYRENSQPAFTDAAIDGVRNVASMLMACVQRHVVLRTPAAVGGSPLDKLPRREKEVCERLLKGWTQDGIAVDLGLTPATVKTYRNRAFVSLKIHTRHELSALVSGFSQGL